MTQTIRQRRELHEVCAIGKPAPKLLKDGAVYIPADHHAGSQGLAAFTQRQVDRGLIVKERK